MDETETMPRVVAYPKCEECGAAFVLRMCFSFGTSDLTHDWLWQRDCKHKKAGIVAVGPTDG